MNEDQTIISLQLEFDEILSCIKPIYLSWKNSQDKIFIAGWIRKLTGLKSNTVDSMHLRNLYILALYENLRRNVLCDPFTKNAPHEELPPISSHLKQLIEKFSTKQNGLDWLETNDKINTTRLDDISNYEEDEYISDIKFTGDGKLINTEKFCHDKFNELESKEFFGNIYKYHTFNDDWIRHSNNPGYEKECKTIEEGEILKANAEDMRAKFTLENNKFQEKEMEKRLVQLQDAYHQDVLKLRNQKDLEIQNIISRKNLEIDQIRNNFKEKVEEQEIQMKMLESKANECLRQLQFFQDAKSKEIEMLKKNHNEMLENRDRDHDQRILNLMDDLQKEKQKLLEDHQKREEMLIQESKEYFEKIKLEFNEKAISTNRQIINLEKDIVDLKKAKSVTVEQNEKIKFEKEDLIVELKKVQSELTDSQKRYQLIDSQYNQMLNSHTNEMKSLKDNLETALHKAECAKDNIQVMAYEKVEKLENQVKDLQIRLQDGNRMNLKEIETLKCSHDSEKVLLKKTYEDEIENLKIQLKNSKSHFDSVIHDLEKKCDLKETQLNQVNKELELKEKANIQIMEDLKVNLTHSHENQLRKKKIEFERIEAELKQEIQEKTKEIIELIQQLSSHKQETEIKLAEIRKWSDNQISSLTDDWKEEKHCLEKEFQIQLKKIKEDHKSETETLEEEKLKKNLENQNLIENMRREIPILKRELYQKIQIHKNETSDLIDLYEKEKCKLIEEHKGVVENLNQKLIDSKTNMEKDHAQNISQILSKTNEKLKEIENEYSEKSMQSFKIINDLKLLADKLKDEKKELIKSHEDFKCNLIKKHNAEAENIQRVIKINLETYKKEMSNEQLKSKNLEKQFEKRELENKKQISILKYEFESRLSKLLPLEIQNDYEETIQSLRNQITFLQQKIGILEDEINSFNNYNKTFLNEGFSKSNKYEQLFES